MKTLAQISYGQLLHKSVACFLVFSMLFVVPAQVALATPTNGNIVEGQAGVSQIANTTTVDVMTSNAVINWDSLDTTSAEVLQFLHDGGHFAVLNRVIQGGMTQFDGSLFGNQGTIIVVNPNGIAFGPTALIQAYQFTASSLNLSNENFMNGVYQFAGGGMGDVSNYGNISAEQVALIAKKVHNAGTISSPGGFTIMAAGDSVYLGSEASNVVIEVAGVTVSDGAMEGIGDVVNEGTIEATDGKIIMAAGDTYIRAIDGLDTLTVAVASGIGTVQQRGTLTANGSEGTGGSIQLSAASEVLFADGSLTTANAGANGDGGEVIAYSPGLLTFSDGALIEAKGGSESGNGGFAEVSGVDGVFFGGVADLTAVNGEDGMLLIDPRNMTISDAVASYHNINIGNLEHQLNHHSSVTVNTSNYSGNEAGNLTVNDDINWYSHRDLTLKAKADLTVNDAITNTGSGDLTLRADRHITINAPISVGDDLNLFADASGNVVGDMHSGIGATLHAGDDIDIKGNEIILGDAVSAGDDLTITGRDCVPVENDYVWGDVWALSTLDAGGDIKISVTGEEKILVKQGYYTYKWICGHRKKVWIDTSYYDYIYHPGTIYLYDDVTAGCDLSLFNNTYTANGVTLQAGRNVNLVNDNAGPTKKNNATFLKGTKWLEIIAGAKPGVTNGEIHADNTEISVTGSTLIMQQDVTLNTNDYLFDNQGNTDLTLISNNGSVISDMSKAVNAADEWASIGASAKYHVFLEGNGSIKLGDSGTDSTKSVVTQIGDIDVIAGYNVDATKDIKAGDDLRISAKHGVNLQAAESGDDMTIKADVDKYWGENVTANGKLEAGDDMTLEGSNVILKDSAEAGDTMDILAHGLYSLDGSAPGSLVGSGDVLVDDSLKSGGNMTVTAIRKTGGPANGPGFNGGSVPYTANGSILIDGNADAGGTMDMNAGHDLIVKGDTLSGGNMTMNAGDDIRLKRNVNSGADIYLDADDDVELNKDAGSTVAAGNIDIHSSNTTTYLYSDVTAGGDISLHNNTWADGGITLDAGDDVEAYGTITGAGNLDINADDNIRLRKNVDVADRLTANAGSDIVLNSVSGTTKAGEDLDLTAGYNVDARAYIEAGDDIRITAKHGVALQAAKAGDDMTIKADVDKYWGENVTANGKLQAGDDMTLEGSNVILKDSAEAGDTMDILAHGLYSLDGSAPGSLVGSGDVLVDDSLKSGGNMTVTAIRKTGGPANGPGFNGGSVPYTANGSILIDGNADAGGTMDMNAGHDLIVKGDTLSGGNMTMNAGDDIRLKRNVNSGADIYLDADDDVELNKDAGSTVAAGNIDIHSSNTTTYLYSDVTAGGDISLHNNTWAGPGTIHLDAGDDIEAYGTITGAGSLDVEADDNIRLRKDVDIAGSFTGLAGNDMIFNANGGNVEAGNVIDLVANRDIISNNNMKSGGSMNLEAGRDIIIKGNTTSGGNMTMNAGDDIRLKKNVSSGANIDLDANDDVELNINGGTTTAADNIDIYSADTTTYLYANVTAGGDISLHNNTWAAGGIKLDAGDDVEGYGTITGAGDLDVEADDNIRLRKNVDVAGTLNAKAKNTIELNKESGQTTTGAAMILTATNRDIIGYRNINSGTAMTMNAGRDIKLNEKSGNTNSGTTMNLNAGNDILVDGTTTSGGNMTMNAGDDIRLRKNVSSGANIDLDANDDVELNINGGNTTAVGTIDIYSGNTTTYLYSNMSAGGNITLHNNTWTQDGIKIDSDENVTIKGTVTGAGDLTIEAGSIEPGAYSDKDDITLLKSVTVAGDLDMTAGNDIFAHGKLTTTGTNGTGDMTLNAGDDMYLKATPISADSAGMMTLTAHLDPTNPGSGNVDVEGDLFANNTIEITASENTIYLAGDVKTTDGDVIFNNNVIADGSGSQSFDADGSGKKLIARSSTTKTEPGSLTLDGGWNAGYEIELDGDVTVTNGTLYVGEAGSYDDETTVAAGKKLESINGDVRIASDINGEGDLTVKAGDDLRVYGNTNVAGHLAMYSGTVSGQESEMRLENVTAETMFLRAGTGTVDGTLRDRIKIYGDVESTVGDTEMVSDDYIYVDGDVTAANDAKLIGNNDHPAGGIVGDVKVTGDVDAQNDIIAEGRNISIYGQATAGNDVKIDAADYGTNGSDGDVYVGDGIDAGRDILVNATDDITLGTTNGVSGNAGGNIVLMADGGSYDSPYGGDVTVYGDLLADGSIEIDAADDTIYLYGDTHAGDNVSLMANTKLKGNGDQWITAGSYVEADGYVRKVTEGDMWVLAEGANEDGVSLDFRYISDDETDPAVSAYKGNIWMIGAEDIQISGDVTTFGPDVCGNTQEICSDDETGGVLIYSIDGGIYTEGDDGALTVNVTGYSDHYNGWGIYNPLLALNDNSEEGGKVQAAASEIEEVLFNRVAIAIVSNDTLVLGPEGSLNAYGVYYDDVDDRAMINFLDIPDEEIPLGGPVRDEGDPFDLAIYVASTGTDSEDGQGPEGNVHIDMPVQIHSKVWVPYEDVTPEPTAARIDKVESSEEGYWTCETKGTMVIDSYDTITFGKNFEASLFGGEVGDRLEVVSRISEWLEDAFGRLPYAEQWAYPNTGPNPPFPEGYNYVLRGAGLENPDITDGRAWVLESRAQNGPVPLAALDIPETKGCPVEMDAAASELAINTEQLQLLIGNSLANNPNLQPCQACQKLLTAANILKDAEGTRMAAMSQIFNTLAPADAPFTPEVSAAVATAFAGMAEDDPQYALAREYVDAFVSYVSVLDRDLQVPVGDPVALVMEKYGETLANSDNPNIAAFVASQIEASMGGAL